jgi:serine/threonine protein phosphatase PrpC
VIPSERSHLFASAITHPGMTGKDNEDRYSITAYRLEDEDHTPVVFAIIADGVGGHRAGEIAAEIAVNMISHAIATSDGSEPLETLEYAIIQAGEAIFSQSSKDEAQRGMGSTCVCVWVIGDRLYTASVGDSRIYLLRDNAIRQITVDHTWVQEALDHGIIQPEQARNHPRSHIIRRYLGSKSTVVPDLRLKLSPEETDEQAHANQGFQLAPGDQLLMCTDGLTDLVEDHEILTAFQDQELSDGLATLVELANQRGGHDNITILSLKVPTPNEVIHTVIPDEVRTTPAVLPWMTCVIIGIIAVLIIAISATAIWFFNRSTDTPTPTLMQETTIPATFTLTPEELQPTETPIPSETPIQVTLTSWPTDTPDS